MTDSHFIRGGTYVVKINMYGTGCKDTWLLYRPGTFKLTAKRYGVNDIILRLASILAGYPILLPSPREILSISFKRRDFVFQVPHEFSDLHIPRFRQVL